MNGSSADKKKRSPELLCSSELSHKTTAMSEGITLKANRQSKQLRKDAT